MVMIRGVKRLRWFLVTTYTIHNNLIINQLTSIPYNLVDGGEFCFFLLLYNMYTYIILLYTLTIITLCLLYNLPMKVISSKHIFFTPYNALWRHFFAKFCLVVK